MNTFAEAVATQNLLPLVFQEASILAFFSFTAARPGFSPLISLLSSQTMTPLSVEELRSKFVKGCQSRELTGFRCYIIFRRQERRNTKIYLFKHLDSFPLSDIRCRISFEDPNLIGIRANCYFRPIFVPSEG